ncbi:hypothetical protein ABK040_007831 [Willaertia magna]
MKKAILGVSSVCRSSVWNRNKSLLMFGRSNEVFNKSIFLNNNTLFIAKYNNIGNTYNVKHFHSSQISFGVFSGLTNKMVDAFGNLFKKKTLTKEDVEEAMKKVRVALLDADVAESVVNKFINEITEQAIGVTAVVGTTPSTDTSKLAKVAKLFGVGAKEEELPKAATVYAMVQDKLADLLGTSVAPLELNPKDQKSIILMTGIQGSGKTTTSAKLAYQLKKEEYRRVLLVSLDTYRPAAQKQLETLGQQIQVESLPIVPEEKPLDIAKRALKYEKDGTFDTIIFDTAGRMHIDEDLMKELEEIRSIVTPNETILVADSMLGNDAVNIASQFHDRVGLSGVILTRMDGTSSGGCAISMKTVVGLSVKYIGTGERMEELEQYDPESLSKRILGEGDILTLAKKAKDAFNMDAKTAQQKLVNYAKGNFTFIDYQSNLAVFKQLGSLKSITSYLPQSLIGKYREQLENMDLSMFDKHDQIINSMSEAEKLQPLILESSSAKRIALAKKAKVEVAEVNKFLKFFEKMKTYLGRFGSATLKDPKKMQEAMMKDPSFLTSLFPQKVKRQLVRR